MCGRWRWSGMGVFCAILCVGNLQWIASAGIPEPGILLYGQVLDDSGALITEGELTIQYQPEGSGQSLTMIAPLADLDGPAGRYSYRVVIPFETEVPNFPLTQGRLPLSPVDLTYTRTMGVAGTNISMAHDITISEAGRGSSQRVDVCNGCPPLVRIAHSADLNTDYRFSLGEFLRVYELHIATPTHEYHTDPATEDGYGPGPGPHGDLPHTADYDGGADWTISMAEVLRMVDLFMSTNDHSYSPFPRGDDGFQKGYGELALETALSPVQKSGASPLATRLQASGVSGAAAGGSLPVTVVIQSLGETQVSALGLRASLPAGWAYAGLEGPAPFIRPSPLEVNLLEFAWSDSVAVPFRFTFLITPAGQAAVLGDPSTLAVQAVYRVRTGRDERRSPVAYLSIQNTGEDGDTDADRVRIAAAPPVGDTGAGTDSTEPVSTEPGSIEPVSTEPVSTEPVSTEPGSTERPEGGEAPRNTVTRLGSPPDLEASREFADTLARQAEDTRREANEKAADMPAQDRTSLALLAVFILATGCMLLNRRRTANGSKRDTR